MQAAVTKKSYSLGYKKAFVTGGSGFVGRALIATLLGSGVHVAALARSDAAEAAVKECGSGVVVVRGDLSDVACLKNAMEGCEVVFHCAALTDLNSPWEQFEDIIVEGTRRVLQAAVECNIQRVVNVSSEAALVTGFGYPLVDVDDIVDHLPDPDTQIGLNYPRAKNLAERVCQSFASQIHVVTVRPRFIWGAGDTVVMKHLVEQAKSLTGFAWIGGAEFMTSTANISNVIHGILLASEKGVSGHSYFLTDEEDLTLKEMFTKLFSTQRIDSSSFPSLPILLAKALAWTGLIPDVNATSMALLAQQVTVKCPKAKEDLGYSPIVSMDQGMEELRVGFDMKS